MYILVLAYPSPKTGIFAPLFRLRVISCISWRTSLQQARYITLVSSCQTNLCDGVSTLSWGWLQMKTASYITAVRGTTMAALARRRLCS